MGRTGELIWQLNGKASDFTIEPRARFAREYAHPGGVLSTSQGNVHQLGDGGVLAGWGSQPHFSEHAPNGALRSAGRLPSGRCATRESHVQAMARDSRGA